MRSCLPVVPVAESMRDLMLVTFHCERWVITAVEEALGEQAEQARSDGDEGLSRWADGLEDLQFTAVTVEARPGPPGATWSWRDMRYRGETPHYSDAT